MKINFYALIFLLSLFSLGASAQAVPDSARLAIGIDGGVPAGGIASQYVMFFGGSLRFDYPFSKKSYVTLSAGYNEFLLANGATTTQNAILNVPVPPLQTAPFMIGYKYFFIRTLYIQGELGETLLINKDKVFAPKAFAFTYAPQLGLILKSKKHPHTYWDVGVRYQGTSSFYYDDTKYNYWAGRISYSFNL